MIRRGLLLFLWCVACFSGCFARVVRVEVTKREDVLGGKAFGAAGAYEKVVGKVYFTADPRNAHNKQIVDLDKADRNSRGLVEYSADFYVLRPKEEAKGNGAMLFEVSNRGGKGILSVLQRAKGSRDPRSEAEFGDGFLMSRGYTLAWVGWQWDVPRTADVLKLDAPIAYGANHSHLSGLVRGDFTPDESASTWSLAHIMGGNNGGNSYDVSDPNDARNVLTVREHPADQRVTIARSKWRFGADRHSVELDGGFDKGRIYEVVYVAQDPVVAGLGLAAVRDFLSYAKYDRSAVAPAQRVLAMGISQSGRFLRHFLYQDFNTDEDGRAVMDGVLAHVAGAGRGSFNHRFAQPSRDAQPMSSIFYPTDLFPFTDTVERDPETGSEAGLLEHTQHAPKIFFSNTSYEYWGRAASLIHTTADGRRDVAPAENVRIYFFAGLMHYSRAFPPAPEDGGGQQMMNTNPITWYWRALVTNMDAWVRTNTQPPASV